MRGLIASGPPAFRCGTALQEAQFAKEKPWKSATLSTPQKKPHLPVGSGKVVLPAILATQRPNQMKKQARAGVMAVVLSLEGETVTAAEVT